MPCLLMRHLENQSFQNYQVSVLATAYQARDVVSRCLSPAAAGENLEGEGAADLEVVVLVAAFHYSLDSAPGIKN